MSQQIFQTINSGLEMRAVAEHFGYKPSRAGFIRSPWSEDRTPSCKLYPHGFFDFSTSTGGDCIRFAALVLGLNNWQAAQYLVSAFNLPLNLSATAETREEIRKCQAECQRRREAEERFQAARLAEIETLKARGKIYRTAIANKVFSPLSAERAFIEGQLQAIAYTLDTLCMGSRAEQEMALAQRR